MGRFTETGHSAMGRLFSGFDHCLAVEAVLRQLADGQVWIGDDGDSAATVRTGYRHHLAVESIESGQYLLAEYLDGLFACPDTFGPYMLYADRTLLGAIKDGVMAERYPLEFNYAYYELDTKAITEESRLLSGYSLANVDTHLVGEKSLAGMDELLEEMCSERSSVADFLARSFGLALIHDDQLVGWCLSEYNTASRCEVGIGVSEGHRRKGLATAMARAFSVKARERGLQRIGWHCSFSNTGSRRVAECAGFSLSLEYPVLFGYTNEAMNLAVNGNVSLQRGKPEEAAAWFARAFAIGCPEWALLPAARACCRSGDLELAQKYVDRALQADLISAQQLAQDGELGPFVI